MKLDLIKSMGEKMNNNPNAWRISQYDGHVVYSTRPRESAEGMVADVKLHPSDIGWMSTGTRRWTVPSGTITLGDCGRCAGTGEFITYIENGTPKGPGGICFRCNGKGFQTEADEQRNWGYDSFYVKITIE